MITLAVAQGAYPSDPILNEINSHGIAQPRARAKAIAEWMSKGNDLILVGRIASSRRDSSRLDGGGFGFERGRMCVRVEDILRGYTSGPVVCFTHFSQIATFRIQPGQRVLVWITRRPDLPRDEEGNFYVIDRDGVLLSDGTSSSASSQLRRDPRKMRLEDIPLDVVRQRDIRTILHGAVALASVRFTETGWSLSDAPWKCEDARWIFGMADRTPTFVRFANTSRCGVYPEAAEHVIPVPRGYHGDTLFVNACPPCLRIMAGQVTALGVAVSDLSKVLTLGPDGTIEVIEPAWSRRER